MIVWVVSTEDHQTGGDQRLHGYDGETGAVVYGGGGPNELMAGTHYYSTTGIAARGRIYVAGDNKVYAFQMPEPTPAPRATPSPRPRPTPERRPTPPQAPSVVSRESQISPRVSRRAEAPESEISIPGLFKNERSRLKNGLTKSGQISINGVFLHLEVS